MQIGCTVGLYICNVILNLYYMLFKDLMQQVNSMFKSWLNDEEMNSHYCGNKEEIQKQFIACIQVEIGSDLVVMTKEELEKHRMDFHLSMEGTSDWNSWQ